MEGWRVKKIRRDKMVDIINYYFLRYQAVLSQYVFRILSSLVRSSPAATSASMQDIGYSWNITGASQQSQLVDDGDL